MAKKEKAKKETVSQCELCAYYEFDDDMEMYVCQMNLDEDEMVSFLQGHHSSCPYFRFGDEYAVVRKQN